MNAPPADESPEKLSQPAADTEGDARDPHQPSEAPAPAGGDVIPPTAAPANESLPGWTQDDYRFLWACVIEAYVDTVLFIDGWQYSNGCAYEFLTAQRQTIRTLDEQLRPLHITEGVCLLRDAITELHDRKQSTTFLKNVLNELVALPINVTEELCPKP